MHHLRLMRAAQILPDQAILSAQAELSRRSFRHYCRFAWNVIEPSTPLIWDWYMDCMADHAEAMIRGEINWLIVNIPPGHGKSTLWSVFLPSYTWTINPAIRFISGAHSMSLSTRDAVRTRDLILSKWYQQIWGNRFALTKTLETYYNNDHMGHRIAVSVGGGMGMRADFGILDDPQTNAQAHSNQEAEAGWQWCKGEYIQRLNTTTDRPSRLVVVMQRLSKIDLTARLLDHYGPKFDLLCLTQRRVIQSIQYPHPEPGETSTALTRRGEATDPRQTAGELLCPAKVDESAVQLMEKDAYTFAAQCQQKPVDRDGSSVRFNGFSRSSVVPFASHFGVTDLHEATRIALDRGWQFGSGWDHGIGAGKEVAVLIAWHKESKLIHVLDTYVNAKRTTPTEDAVAFRSVLNRWGLTPRHLRRNRGDVNGAGKSDTTGWTINEQIERATDDSGVVLGFKIETPNKVAGSVETGIDLINTFLFSRGILLDPAAHVVSGLMQRWSGEKDGTEHAIDALRYVCAPILSEFLRPEGHRRKNVVQYA